jgi:Secretion system C-terminal sorting domain
MVAMVLYFLPVTIISAQTPVALKIYATDGVGRDSVIIGVHPDATGQIDGTLGEFELPPLPPTFDFRSVSDAGWDTLGLGARINYHHLHRDTQTDIYKLQFQSDEYGNAVIITWPSGLAKLGAGYWKLTELDGAPLCDMTAETSYTYHTMDMAPQRILLVKGDGLGFLTATSDSLINAVDYKGKMKAERRKSDKVFFSFPLVVPAQGTYGVELNLKSNIYISGVIYNDTVYYPFAGKKILVNFPVPLDPGTIVTVEGVGDKGKYPKITKAWGRNKANLITEYDYVNIGYPMPNWNNVGEETYAQMGPPWGTGYGIVVGSMDMQGYNYKGKPIYRYVYHKKWNDVLKTLYKKNYGGYTKGGALCLNFDLKGKEILKPYKSLSPHKARQPNELLVELLALKVNIGISEAGVNTNTGFGDLHYICAADDPAWANDITVDSIAFLGDKYISCDSTSPLLTGMELLQVIKRINETFAGPFDTLSFVSKTFLKPARALAEVSRLYRPSLSIPLPLADPGFVYHEMGPSGYALDQNYPNPFNPTTTIGFELTNDAVVSLKVYNMLGQQVATILDHEEFLEGSNEVEFNASNLASGVYVYQLDVDNGKYRQLKKMILLR